MRLAQTYDQPGICAQAQQAYDDSTPATDRRGLAYLSLALGRCATTGGDPELARRWLEETVSVAQELQDSALEFHGLNGLGIQAFLLDDLERAVDLLRRALAVDGGPPQKAWPSAINNLILALLKLDRLIEIAALQEEARRAENAGWESCNLLHTIGLSLRRYEFDRAAAPILTQAVDCAESSPERPPFLVPMIRASKILVEIPKTATGQEASKALRELDEMASRLGLIENQSGLMRFARILVYQTQAEAFHRVGNPHQALETLERAIALAAETDDLPMTETHLVRSEYLLQLGRSKQAGNLLDSISSDAALAGPYLKSEWLRLRAATERSRGDHEKALAFEQERRAKLLPWLNVQRSALLATSVDDSLRSRLLQDLQSQMSYLEASTSESQSKNPWIAWVLGVLSLVVMAACVWVLLSRRQLKRQLEKQTLELHEQIELLRNEKETAQTHLRSMAHDLRNPLTVVLGGLQLMDIGPSERRSAELRRVRAGARRLSRMLEDTMALIKLEREDALGREMRCDVHDVARRAVRQWQTVAANKSLDIALTISAADTEELVARADSSYLSRVVDNLLSNAIKYSRPNGAIRVDLSRTPDGVEVSVSDDGVGVSASELGAIFEPFAKISSEPTAGEPKSGLGLALAKRIVERLGGEIHATSLGRDKGLEVRVTLPRFEPS